MHRMFSRVSPVAALVLLASASPAMAQDQDVSFFQQFLWSDDPLGLAVIWLLIAMSFVVLGFAIKLFLQYRRSSVIPEDTQIEVEQLLADKKYREAIEFVKEDNSYLGRLVSSAMAEASNGYGAMERAVEETGDAETSRILRPVEYLNVIGNIAPMLGLFGTVYGMIVAFQQLVAAGPGGAEPSELAAGISTALVTTFWGLIVAMPSLAAYALIRNRIDALTADGLLAAEELIRPFKPGKKSSSSKRSAASPKPEKEKEGE